MFIFGRSIVDPRFWNIRYRFSLPSSGHDEDFFGMNFLLAADDADWLGQPHQKDEPAQPYTAYSLDAVLLNYIIFFYMK